MTRRLPVFVVAAFFCLLARLPILQAQVVADSSDVSFDGERLLDLVETENDQSELIDRLEWLQEHPFDLNTASKEELATIPRLVASEVNAILQLRREVKFFTSVSQLGGIAELGDAILQKIRPYVFIDQERKGASGSSFSMTSRVSKDLQPRRGFQDSSFVGTQLKSYNRFALDQGGLFQAGALFEKDAGEQFANSFLSGYVAVRDWSFLSRLIVGDFVVESGQGLALWRASAFGKSSEAVSTVKKTGLGPQPYRSTDEFNFMRGIALSSDILMGENALSLTAFYSRRSLSAGGSDTSITSFYEEGLLRTESELQKKSNVVERIIGGRLQVRSTADWNLGSTLYQSQFSKPIQADGVFDFRGSSTKIYSVDAEVNLGLLTPLLSEMTLFGEFARSAGGSAGVIGTSFDISRGTDVALVYREYSPGFVSLHAAGFGERSETKNERGFYMGAEVRLSKLVRVSGYLDLFRFPWRTFSNLLPSSGRDMLLQVEAAPMRLLELTLRYSNKTSETTEAGVDYLSREIRILSDRTQQRFRLTATYRASKQIRLRGRIEKSTVGYSSVRKNESGLLFYQEVQYSLPSDFSAEARLIFFDTDSYDSRVYEYENDLRGVVSNPALYGKGRRWYLLIRWKSAPFLNLSCKYSETQFDGVKSIGSGLTEIQGDLDNRFALQFDLRL